MPAPVDPTRPYPPCPHCKGEVTDILPLLGAPREVFYIKCNDCGEVWTVRADAADAGHSPNTLPPR